MSRIDRRAYADMFGPTVGDRVRLGDTELWIEVEEDKKYETLNAEEEKKRIEDLKSEIQSIETNLEDTENNNVTDEEKSFLDEI